MIYDISCHDLLSPIQAILIFNFLVPQQSFIEVLESSNFSFTQTLFDVNIIVV
jgi:hypothetical protein